MSSKEYEKDINNRRDFFQGIASGVGGIAMIAAAAQMGVPILNAAQGTEMKPKPDAVSAATQVVNQAVTPDPAGQMRPWPKGTSGNEYDYLFTTRLREPSSIPEVCPGPWAHMRGISDLPGTKINMGWKVYIKPYKMEMQSHHHDHDEYQIFFGAEFPDLVGSFDAEVEHFIGPEYERHIITKATILYLPAGLEHCPIDIRRVGKPMLFSSLELAPFYSSIFDPKTMGYMEVRNGNKIDMKGNPI